MGRKINPLHTPEQLLIQMQQTGEYPDGLRNSGRTTRIALALIHDSLGNPYVSRCVKDHEGGVAQNLLNTVCHMVRQLNLRHMYACHDMTYVYLCFGEPPEAVNNTRWVGIRQ